MAVKQNGVLATFTPTVSKYTNFTVNPNYPSNLIAASGYNIYTCPAATLTSGKLVVSNNTGGALNIDVGIVEQTDVIQLDSLASIPGSQTNYGSIQFSSNSPTSYTTSIVVEGGGVTGSFQVGESVSWTNTNTTPQANTAVVHKWDSVNSKLWLRNMSQPNGLDVAGDITITGGTSNATISAGPSYAGSGGTQGWAGWVRFYDSLNGRIYFLNQEFRNNIDHSVLFDTVNENREQANNNLNRSLARVFRPVETTQKRYAAGGTTTPVTEFISQNDIECPIASVTAISEEQYLVQDKQVADNDIFELNGIVLGTYQSLYVKSTGALTFSFIGFEEAAEIPS